MKPNPLLIRRLAIGASALVLLAGVAYVFVRTGPLAPVKVTVAQATEGSLSPAIFGIGTVGGEALFGHADERHRRISGTSVVRGDKGLGGDFR